MGQIEIKSNCGGIIRVTEKAQDGTEYVYHLKTGDLVTTSAHACGKGISFRQLNPDEITDDFREYLKNRPKLNGTVNYGCRIEDHKPVGLK